MNIEQGEEIVSALVSGHINGTGRYKFFAKKRKDNKCEWAHFVAEMKQGIPEFRSLPGNKFDDTVN